MSLNGRNGDRNRDRCHGTVEIVTEVLMVTEVPSTGDSSVSDCGPVVIMLSLIVDRY